MFSKLKEGQSITVVAEDEPFSPPSKVSYNLDVFMEIKKNAKNLKFKSSNYTSYGIEGIALYKQPNGKVGRYLVTIRKVGLA